jgi:hypothetical protein
MPENALHQVLIAKLDFVAEESLSAVAIADFQSIVEIDSMNFDLLD